MNKSEFLKTLRQHLHKFNNDEVNDIIAYYDEMIEEKKETGLSETEAIASLGDITTIVNRVTADLVITRSQEKTSSPLKNFLIILGICATPILIPIGIAFFAVFFALLVVIIALISAFFFSGVSIILAIIPMVFEMVRLGSTTPAIILNIGVSLMTSGLLILLGLLVIKIGSIILNTINQVFSKLIRKKSKGA